MTKGFLYIAVGRIMIKRRQIKYLLALGIGQKIIPAVAIYGMNLILYVECGSIGKLFVTVVPPTKYNILIIKLKPIMLLQNKMFGEALKIILAGMKQCKYLYVIIRQQHFIILDGIVWYLGKILGQRDVHIKDFVVARLELTVKQDGSDIIADKLWQLRFPHI